MRRYPIREGVISNSVAVGEQSAWLGRRQHASPEHPPFLLSREWGSPGRMADTPDDPRMDSTAHPAAVPECCCRKGKQQVGAEKRLRHVQSCP